ncbi:hypothetical protein [Anabaena azotica]|uniref:Uncharacterized protein n=1 Tax=Anabaena azotica FACHB-119 TaxID=947527 RepID=A0ABR8DHM7_9NOST|nr:hypothetical protein [Anabaena azotica]MBD2505687.1 hypothetical protein [Anabaena azotica FACHB-119]
MSLWKSPFTWIKGDRKVFQTLRSPLFLLTTLWGATAQSLGFGVAVSISVNASSSSLRATTMDAIAPCEAYPFLPR